MGSTWHQLTIYPYIHLHCKNYLLQTFQNTELRKINWYIKIKEFFHEELLFSAMKKIWYSGIEKATELYDRAITKTHEKSLPLNYLRRIETHYGGLGKRKTKATNKIFFCEDTSNLPPTAKLWIHHKHYIIPKLTISAVMVFSNG